MDEEISKEVLGEKMHMERNKRDGSNYGNGRKGMIGLA